MRHVLCCSSSLFMGGAGLALFQKVPVLKLKECTVHPPSSWRADRRLIQRLPANWSQDKGEGFSFTFGLSWVEAIFPWCSVLKWPLRMYGQGHFRPPVAVWGPQADGKADNAFCFLRRQFSSHRLWVKFLFITHPSSKVLPTHQPKENPWC